MTDQLRRLDEDLVPRFAAALQRLVRRVLLAGRQPGWTADAASAFRGEPAVAGGIVAVLVAGVLLAIAGDRIDTTGPPSPAGAPLPSAPPSASIGPLPGASVPPYLNLAAANLRHFGEIAHGRTTYAAVDLRHYLTPAQARRVVAGVTVVRAFVRVPSRLPTQVRAVPVDRSSDLTTGMVTAGTVAAATVKSYRSLLASLHPNKPADRVVKRRYAEQRRAAALEARRLRHPATCRCVFAFVVRAGATRLADLARRPGVRVVDPAPPAVPIGGLTVFPLQPQVTRVIPRVGLPSG